MHYQIKPEFQMIDGKTGPNHGQKLDSGALPSPESRIRSVNSEDCVSPALIPWKRGEAGAYELKFLLDESRAFQVEQFLAGGLVRDPHADPDLGHAYQITTVYCDTPDFDVFHRNGSYRRRKFRLRSYGPDTHISLERKTKSGNQVRKKRTIVSATDLSNLSHSELADHWEGKWFHQHLLNRRLRPVCCISYLRTAFVGMAEEGPMRLTFDRNLSGFTTSDWAPRLSPQAIQFLAGQVVCEFKFRGSMPAQFRAAIQELHLDETGNSKYRNCLIAAAVQTERGA